ncbi:hypothetical protein [Massilia glaciei]|uniref:DUF333 domain-containing protein n=1 Tax=Massilia glaciei TaxID=1524097 RepID=A0A2U2HJH5_9BURK|nr:hypothetical protein [Massilia glaciei]PWF46861.1 hypothetical protein C7C56_015030 [Massilia glaciei]
MKRLVPVTLLAFMGAAFAQPQHPERGERCGPPQEAFAACKGKQQGDKVKAKMPRGDVSGTCKLVLIPDDLEGQAGGAQRPRERR